MKPTKIREIIKKSIIVVFSALLYSLAIKLVVQPSGFLSGGVSGITIVISKYMALNVLNQAALESFLYSVLYIIFNIPIAIFGFKKLGKNFVGYSVLNVLLSSIFVSVIPLEWANVFQLSSIDPLTCAIIAAFLTGAAGSIAFMNGFSSGGTDIISMHLSRTKGKGIGSYNFLMNIFILIVGGILFKDYDALIYTIIYFFINKLVVNNLYIDYKKVMLEIVTSKKEEMVEELMKESHHGCTIIKAIGAYSGNEKDIVRIVISANEARRVNEMIKRIDPNNFTAMIDVKQLSGRFYLPPID